MKFILIIAITIQVIFNSAAVLLLRYGMRDKELLEKDNIILTIIYLILDPFFIGGVIFFGIALIFYTIVVSKIPVSLAYPIMTSSAFVLVYFVSYFLLDEKITPIHIFGTVFIIIGVFLVASQMRLT